MIRKGVFFKTKQLTVHTQWRGFMNIDTVTKELFKVMLLQYFNHFTLGSGVQQRRN